MATLKHEHGLLKVKDEVQESTHRDSWGNAFGGGEHVALLAKATFATDSDLSQPIQHKHAHIEEVVDQTTHLRSWKHRPPSRVEAEREIDATQPQKQIVAARSVEIEEDEDFPVE